MKSKNRGEKVLGEKFGLLTVVSKAISKNGARWNCLCECGNETVVYGYKLKSGHTKSCGCLKRQTKSEETRAKIGEANRRSTMFTCDFCGSLSFEKPSHYEKTNKHFCSMLCYTRYRAEVLHFTEQNSYKGVRKPGESKQVYHRRYAKRNPERIARLKARRYAREKNAEGSHTLEEWNELKARFQNRCAHCRKE
ncbi:MAG: hypothetical protein AB2401_03610, partial [Bacillus sp. (in: firmicutes)]